MQREKKNLPFLDYTGIIFLGEGDGMSTPPPPYLTYDCTATTTSCRYCLKAEERLSSITAFYIALKFKAIIYPFALGWSSRNIHMHNSVKLDFPQWVRILKIKKKEINIDLWSILTCFLYYWLTNDLALSGIFFIFSMVNIIGFLKPTLKK